MSRSRAAHRIICALARNAEATSMATQGMLAQRMTSLLANGAQVQAKSDPGSCIHSELHLCPSIPHHQTAPAPIPAPAPSHWPTRCQLFSWPWRVRASSLSSRCAWSLCAQMGSTGARCPCGRTLCPGHRYSTSSDASLAQAARAECVSTNLAGRMETVLQHFPKALNADDFIARVEIALAGYGFTGDNSIGKSQTTCTHVHSVDTRSCCLHMCTVLCRCVHSVQRDWSIRAQRKSCVRKLHCVDIYVYACLGHVHAHACPAIAHVHATHVHVCVPVCCLQP